jgi:outer membrane immunogenic protein
MRGFFLVAMVLGAASGVQAADMPDFLRGSLPGGPAPTVNWAGVYIGGQVTHGAADMNFTNSGQDLLAKLLNNVDLETQFNISKWPLLSTAHMQSSGYGGFVGYNFQWSDALVGIELNYTHGDFFGGSSGSQARSFQYPVGYLSTAAVSSSSSMRITDYGSLRVRGGYAVDCFLPYAFVGVALGQANIDRRADASLYYQYVGSAIAPLPNMGPTTHSLTNNANSHFISGLAGGLGIDVMLYEGLFLRAEWEYLLFSSSDNTTVDATINTVRAGLGYKF